MSLAKLSSILFSLFIFLISCSTNLTEELRINTPITQNTTLKKNMTYLVSESIQINANSTLKIEAGVSLSICDTCNIICKGNIIAIGSKNNTIRISGDSLLNNKIVFESNLRKSQLINVVFNSTSILLHQNSIIIDSCSFRTSQSSKNNAFFISGEKSIITLKNSSFYGNKLREGIGFNHGDCLIENNFFDQIPDAIEFSNINGSVILENTILNSPDDGIDLNNCKNILIENNHIRNSKDKGISIGNTKDQLLEEAIIIKNNLINGNKIAVSLKGGSQINLSNCIIESNDLGVAIEKSEKQLSHFTLEIKSSIFITNKQNYNSNLNLSFNNCFIKKEIMSQKKDKISYGKLYNQILKSIPIFE
jgi:hypothetical protein